VTEKTTARHHQEHKVNSIVLMTWLPKRKGPRVARTHKKTDKRVCKKNTILILLLTDTEEKSP
jgi:hypothetical protein